MMVLGPPQSIWQVATTLGFAKQICISGFLAKITGLHRSVVHRHLDHLGAGSSVQWKFPKNAGGRKRKAQDMPMDELPDVLPEFALPPHQLEPALPVNLNALTMTMMMNRKMMLGMHCFLDWTLG